MQIKPLHPNFKTPTTGSVEAGALDLYMPEAGRVEAHTDKGVMVGLGFAAAVPAGCVALLLPRSGTGAKHGLALNNTCGVIDADYRGEWMACLRVHNNEAFSWEEGDRLFQVLIVPVMPTTCTLVDELDTTLRGMGGFGSSGN